MIFDTHAHYENEHFNTDLNAVLTGLESKGVGYVVNPSNNLANFRKAVKIAEKYPFVYAAVGIHPKYAHEVQPGWIAAVEAMSYHPRVVAIGEIGLDYYRGNHTSDMQKDVFREQMRLAQQLKLPVIVHDRDAHQDCLEIVRAFPEIRGVYHCFSGSLEDAKTLVNIGWLLSFSGVVTYKNSKKAREILEWMPLDRIMVESDSPYQAPVPFQGQRNDSGYVYRVIETIAEVKGLPFEEIRHITEENGKNLFGIA